MPKLTTGCTMPDFPFVTPFESGRTLAETAGRVSGKTALIFLRYYGCTLCQYDIHQYAINYDIIKQTGGQVLIVLQSNPDKLAAQLNPGDLPFDIICDPDQTLYQQFEIAPATSMEKMLSPKTLLKISKATIAGFKHGDYEGNEQQLPAVFLIDTKCRLTHVHYGKAAGDVPAPNELAQLMA